MASGASIQCILVSRVADGRYLVAFPSSGLASYGIETNLASCPEQGYFDRGGLCLGGRHDPGASFLHEGLGWLHHCGDLRRDGGCFETTARRVNYPFLYEESDGYLPFAPALMEALEERFSFLSAESGRGGEDGSAALGEPLGALGPRVSRLEDLLGKMSVSLETVLEKVSTGSSKPSTPKVQFAAKPKVIPGAHRQEGAAKFPSLDPSVVASALSAGVPEENLREMERLMGASSKGKKLREPALRKPARKVAEGVLSESEDEVEEAESGSPTTAAQEPGTMEGALSKLTELVTLLSADKIKRAKSSKVDIALENLGANTGGDSSTGFHWQASCGEPEGPQTSFAGSTGGHQQCHREAHLGGSDLADSYAGHAEEGLQRPGLGRASEPYRRLQKLCLPAGVLDDLVNGRVAHARARACLMLVMIDQVAIDRGNWALGAELMLEQGPPLSALASHTLPSISDGESPSARFWTQGGRSDALPPEGRGGLCAEAQSPVEEDHRGDREGHRPCEAEAETEREKPERSGRDGLSSSKAAEVCPSGCSSRLDTKMVHVPGSRAPLSRFRPLLIRGYVS